MENSESLPPGWIIKIDAKNGAEVMVIEFLHLVLLAFTRICSPFIYFNCYSLGFAFKTGIFDF